MISTLQVAKRVDSHHALDIAGLTFLWSSRAPFKAHNQGNSCRLKHASASAPLALCKCTLSQNPICMGVRQVGGGGSVAADAELDSLKDAVEREIVAGQQLIGRWGPLVVHLCHDR